MIIFKYGYLLGQLSNFLDKLLLIYYELQYNQKRIAVNCKQIFELFENGKIEQLLKEFSLTIAY